METRIPFEPGWRDLGELVIEVTPHMVRVWHEYPAMLEEPPYFCPSLYLRSTEEGLPNASDYSLTIRRDWSDLEADPEYGASIPKQVLIKALGLDKAFIHCNPNVGALGTSYLTTGLPVEWFDVFDRFFLWWGGLK